MRELLENAEPRVVGLTLCGVALLVVTLEVTYLLLPQIKTYRSLSSSHQLLQQSVSDNENLQRRLDRIHVEVKDLSQQLHGDMAQLPVKQMESFIIGRLQKLSWATDVELMSVQPSRGRQVQNFRERLFEVKLNARYHEFFDWLQTVNRELGYIVVKQFEIIPTDREAITDPKLSLTLTLVSYRMESKHAS